MRIINTVRVLRFRCLWSIITSVWQVLRCSRAGAINIFSHLMLDLCSVGNGYWAHRLAVLESPYPEPYIDSRMENNHLRSSESTGCRQYCPASYILISHTHIHSISKYERWWCSLRGWGWGPLLCQLAAINGTITASLLHMDNLYGERYN